MEKSTSIEPATSQPPESTTEDLSKDPATQNDETDNDDSKMEDNTSDLQSVERTTTLDKPIKRERYCWFDKKDASCLRDSLESCFV